MKRRDLLILLAVLAVSAILFFATGRRLPGAVQGSTGAAASVRVTVPGREPQLIPLDQSRELTIDQEGGEHNVVSIEPGGFFMKDSSCKNQDCIKQGTVTPDNVGERALGGQVICLPNKVVLELVMSDSEPTETLEIVP